MEKIYTCKICGVKSDVAPFYKGVTSRCQECHKAKVRENRADKVDHYRAYDAQRFQKDPKVKERHKRYQATEAGKASMRKSRNKWLVENQDKRAAHLILRSAVQSGRKSKPDACECCGVVPSRIHGHHEDYTQPLNVIWCCPMCHKKIHDGKVLVELIDGKYTATSRPST